MQENTYILDILSNLGLAINEENNSEIIINFPIKFDKKNKKYSISKDYNTSTQPLGTFLSDFLNIEFDKENDFYDFFLKYSLSIIEYKKLKTIFVNGECDEENFKTFILDLQNNNLKQLSKLQEQIDKILDYCLINPNKVSAQFSPLERFLVLRLIDTHITLLDENKSYYYTINLVSDYPGETEKEIYNFLSDKKNNITTFDLILPTNLSAIIYKSLLSVFKEKIILKNCKNCGKYFITQNKIINYCSNIAPGETKKTCKSIGRKNSFTTSIENDPLLSLYYKLYHKKSAMKRRYPDIEKYVKDFNNYKKQGKIKLDKYKNNQIESSEFEKWLNKNNG